MLSKIDDKESLGRAIFSSSSKGKPHDFIVRCKNNKAEISSEISVDIFKPYPKCLVELTCIQDENAKKRTPANAEKPRKFYGWAKLTVANAKGDDRKIKLDPTPENKYHANIILPNNIDKDAKIEHANQLSNLSVWENRVDQKE